MASTPTAPVEVRADGSVSPEQARLARDAVASLSRYTSDPITGARVTLRRAHHRRDQRPFVADASVLVAGRLLAAHVTGESAEQAARELADRLRRQLRRIEDREVALRNEVRHRPEAELKPPEERRIVHRHPYLDVPLSTVEAVRELLDLDLEFFLFKHVLTEEDVVVYRRDEGGIGLLHPPGSSLAGENDVVTPRPSRYDEPISLSEAREQMDWLNHRFLYFVDAADGRGKVLYLRHDGDYGLVDPHTAHPPTQRGLP
jgi:putative sigma-54 modulation protein